MINGLFYHENNNGIELYFIKDNSLHGLYYATEGDMKSIGLINMAKQYSHWIEETILHYYL